MGGLALLAPVFCFLFAVDFLAANVCNKEQIEILMEIPAFLVVPPEILCPKYTPVALICQYVLHIFVLLFKFDYANICRMTKI